MLCVVLGSYVLSIPLVNLFFDICYEGGGGNFLCFQDQIDWFFMGRGYLFSEG